MFKKQILDMLERKTKQFMQTHKPKLVVVTGSIGKTSTKLAIATVLSQKYRVLTHYGNHNMQFSAPCAIMNVEYPTDVKNPMQWLRVFKEMDQRIKDPFPYDVIIQELGTDQPGDIPHFGKYLRPDTAVVTAVAPEHMEFFQTMDAVAKEELSVANFSNLTVINRDNVDAKYAEYVQTANIDTYGTSAVAEYHYLIENFEPGKGFSGTLVSPEFGEQQVHLQMVGEHSVKPAVAAAAVGAKLELTAEQVKTGLEQIIPVPGRMNLLRGLKNSMIIDDTYNSSPTAAIAALQTLYLFNAPQRIAILGSMNELGDYSKQAHEDVGKTCDATMLDWVVTIGDEAEKYLAPAAANQRCQVRSFKSPYDAGGFVNSVLQPDAVVLAKGSQNGVFAEEAIKVILHSPEEESNLVRQTPFWLNRKRQMFEKIHVEPTNE